MISVLIYFAWSYFSLFCHEMGHFIVGYLVGVSPYLVKIGLGKNLFKVRLFKATFEFNCPPFGGITFPRNLSLDCTNIRLRLVLFTLGGVLANSILLLVLIRISLISIVLRDSLTHQNDFIIWITLLIGIEVYSLFRSLIPRYCKMNQEIRPNDAQIILLILKTNYQEEFTGLFQEYSQQYKSQLSRYTSNKEKLPKTFLANDKRTLNLFIKAQTKLHNEQAFEEAGKLFLEVLKFQKISDPEKVFILDNLACIVTVKGYKKYLNQADKWTQEAIELASHCQTLKGTRGAILIELGRYDEGKQLLLPLTEPGNEELDIAVSSCYLAKAEYFLGNIDKANAWLVNAKKIGNADANRVLKRIQQEINYSVR
ncbi:MAG TPA: site-2 protease family protein [Cyanophyceae cyanobacterium]